MSMTSQRGTMLKVIVTTLILGVTDFLQFAQCSAASNAPISVQNTIMYEFPPSAPTSSVHFSSPPRNLDVAESASFFSDGAIASHPLHGLGFSSPGLTGFMNIRGGSNPFVRSMISAPSAPADILQTAAQTYFIEPVQPTTTTQRPTFKKRKTRRPISVLAEKNKKKQAADNDNFNEVPQGNPVPFNPFRQIVNTSFGRSRPSDSKLGRSRSRPGAGGKQEQPETGSSIAADTNKDSQNEIPATSTEGEPRVLGQRRKPQDVRPLRPTSSISPLLTTQNNENNANAGAFIRELPKPRRFPPRPRPLRPQSEQNDNENNPSGSGDVTNAPSTPPIRPRNLSRPRPTTTLPSTDDLTEITAGVTSYQTQPQSQSPQTVPPQAPQTQAPPQTHQQQEPRRARPGRPLGGVRFGGGRLTLTTTAIPEPDIDGFPVAPSRPRRPIRPSTSTTRQASNPSTETPEFSRLPQPAGIPDVPRRGDRPGFVLRPRPTSGPTSTVPDSDNEVPVNSRPLNRRRKRPTTTAETPSRSVPNVPAVNYNQQFTGGVVQQNVGAQRNAQNQNAGLQRNVQNQNPGLQRNVQNSNAALQRNAQNPNSQRNVPNENEERRIPQVVRTRPSPFSNPEFPSVAQIQVEQQEIQKIVRGQLETLRNHHHQLPEEQPVPGIPSLPSTSPVGNSASLIRRPSGPSAPPAVQPQSIPQNQQSYAGNPALSGPNNFVNSGLYNFPSQENLGFYPGFDNVLGVSSNVKSVQETPNVNKIPNNQFSARTTASADEPEISHSDFSSAEGAEKKTDILSGSTPSPASGEESAKVEPTSAPKKLSPLQRLQQNRGTAARRLLTPRKPTEKTTPTPETQNQKSGKSLRKSIIPPRMLRPRGKLLSKEEEKPEETSAAVEKNEDEKSVENNNGEINNESTSSEPDSVSNVVPISPKTEEPLPTSSRKPSILENAMRRRVPHLPGKNSPLNKSQSEENMKITPPTPANHDPDSPPPNCEAGQRYSKFLKRCVTMYKPKSPGAQG